jgi:hypothetical protein
LDTQININHCKRQAYEKSLNNLPVFFYYEGKTHEKLIYQQSRDIIKQRQKNKNTSHLANNTNKIQIIEIPTNLPK